MQTFHIVVNIIYFRKILDDLAGDSTVKMENYDENGSSNASSPEGDDMGVDKQQQYQSIQLNGVIAPPSGNTVVQLSDGQVSFLIQML